MTFSALFEHSSLGIIISNEDGDIEQTNPYGEKIFGYASGELINKKIEVLIPPHLKEKHILFRKQYNQNPLPRSMGSNLNLLAVKKNGDQFPVEISLTFYIANGKRQIVSFVNDITERKRAEHDLIRLAEELESKVNERTKELSDALLELSHTNEGLNKEMVKRKAVEDQLRSMLEKEKDLSELKSRFVSMASHEFRTPLGGILSSVSLISKYPLTQDEPKREKHIQIIKNSVRNLTNILNDFLSLDKLEEGKVTTAPMRFNFIKLLEEMTEEFKESSKHIILTKHQETEIQLFHDKEMIRNVLINLISNAIKYSPEASTVTITTKISQGNMVIEIHDQGMGIPLSEHKHLFERFFRGYNVTHLQGTGLGLNIVKRYLDLLGGDIAFQSAENQGTTFKVSLPLEKK